MGVKSMKRAYRELFRQGGRNVSMSRGVYDYKLGHHFDPSMGKYGKQNHEGVIINQIQFDTGLVDLLDRKFALNLMLGAVN
jgi:hypothetical protein